MDNRMFLRALNAGLAIGALTLIGLTLYSAFFGVFPDGIQRSAHLLIILILSSCLFTCVRFSLMRGSKRQSACIKVPASYFLATNLPNCP